MIFNGLIAWLLLRNGSPLGWTGQGNFVGDIIATAFILPFIVALIVIPLQKKKLASGKLQAIDFGSTSALQSLVNRMPASTWKLGVIFGLIGALIFAPLLLALVHIAGIEQFSPLNYAIFKGVWAGALAGILVIPMVMCALRTQNLPAAEAA